MVGARQQMPGQAEVHVRPMGNRLAKAESNIGFYLVMTAMLFEFGRPQDLFPPLKIVPIPTLLDVSIALAVLMSGKTNFSNKQTKLWMALLAVMALWVPFGNNNFHALMTFKDMTLCFFFYFFLPFFCSVISCLEYGKKILPKNNYEEWSAIITHLPFIFRISKL